MNTESNLKTPSRTSERERLAEKIEALAAAQKHHDDLVAASVALNTRIRDARSEISEAQKALIEARTRSVLSFAAVAASGGTLTVDDIDEAKNRIARAEEKLGILQSAYNETKAQIPNEEMRVGIKRMNLKDALNAVVSSDPSVAALIEEYRRTQIQAHKLWTMVHSISAFFDDRQRNWGAFPDVVRSLMADTDWSATVERLGTNPDAEFPQ